MISPGLKSLIDLLILPNFALILLKWLLPHLEAMDYISINLVCCVVVSLA